MTFLRTLLLTVSLTLPLLAFSTTNIQLLYGNFDDNSFVYDTANGGKTTLTLEHYRTFEYGDIFMFADYSVASERFKYQDKTTDLYGEISPRISLGKTSGRDLSFAFVKDVYLAFQYNRQLHRFDDYDAYLYGVGSDLVIKGFDIFGLNIYKKNQKFSDNTYQFSTNYSSFNMFGTQLTLDGFTDWTEDDFLTQNKLLYSLGNLFDITSQKVYIGTEWHYYRIKDTGVNSNTWQAIAMVKW